MMNTSTIAWTVVLGVAVTFGAAASAEEEPILNVYNWSDYIGEDTIERFEAETGIKVNYDVYDGNEILESKLLAGNSGYDVVVPTAFPYLARQVAAGVYQPIDKSKVPNFAGLDPDLMGEVTSADPDNAHAAIYQWGTNGFGYNMGMIAERMPDAPVGSLDMLFDPEIVSKFADCGVSLLDEPVEVYPVLLNYLGHDPHTTDLAALEEATDRLKAIRPYVRYFHSSQYINDLANGDTCLAYGWSGDVFQAQYRAIEAENGVDIAYTIPSEGTMMWFDTMAIPSDAPHPENAHKFVDFILRPDVMAGITNYVVYANAVPDSFPMLDPEIANDPAVFPTPEVKERLFVTKVQSLRYERARSRAWTEMKSGL